MSDENHSRYLPAPPNAGGSSVPAIPQGAAVYPAYAYAEPEPEEQALPLSHYLWILRRHKWKILSFVAASVISTLVVTSRITPVYESTATIDVDRQIPAGVIGQDASRATPNDADQFLATQLKLIQSDSVLRPVVEQYHIAARDVSPLQPNLPQSRESAAPVKLANLKVTRPPNTYLLLVSYRSTDPNLAANVANGVARSYIAHAYDTRFRAAADLSVYMEKQLEELKAKMERSSAALAQFEKDLAVINPDEKTSILSSRLLQLNTEYTNAQADRVGKQAAYDSVSGGSLEAAQASAQGDQLRRLSDRLDEAKERLATVSTQYGANHPEYRKANATVTELQRQMDALHGNIGRRVGLDYRQAVNREEMLKKAVAATKAEFDKLNARSFEYKSLKQEADTDKALYEELVRKIKEAGINSSFQNSSLRLADSARPGLNPVFPNKPLYAVLAALFSSMLAIGAAILADAMDNTIRDPEQVKRSLQTEVLGSLPRVKGWRKRASLEPHRGKTALSVVGKNPAALAKAGGPRARMDSAYEEAIRTLRDSILLSDLSRRPRSLLITSAAPREGKTTTACHLAMAHSMQRKTLLIDADLRRPGVHRQFDLPNEVGLSAFVKGEAEWRSLVQKVEAFPNLEVLVGGAASRRAGDRLGDALEQILSDAERDYDLVIVDAPPLLAFAEPLQMAAVVDGVVVIALAGQTNRNAVASVLNSLKRVQGNVIGVALNEVGQDMSDRYYYYGYYGKYYSKYYRPDKG
jgi:capsular exopolysaccharide synthesis family protein